MLQTNTLVGTAVKTDLESLQFSHDKVIDLQHFFVDENGQSYSLRTLAGHFFNNADFQCASHSAVADARMHRKLHKRMMFYHQTNTPLPLIVRAQKSSQAKFVDVGDKCRCLMTQKKTKRGKKKTNKTQDQCNDVSNFEFYYPKNM
jgi:hypothetical protein